MAFVEKFLVPLLRPGQVVVMDNPLGPQILHAWTRQSHRQARGYCGCRRTRRTSIPLRWRYRK